jgi:hypothetical protein
MSAIAAVNSSATSAVASLLSDAASAATAGGSSTSTAKKSDQAASSARGNPVDIVDLSDRAKQILARAKTEQVAADKLAVQAQTAQNAGGKDKMVKSNSDSDPIFGALMSRSAQPQQAGETIWEASAPYGDPSISDADFTEQLKGSLSFWADDYDKRGLPPEVGQALRSAVANGTLKFQKASEVPDLNFRSHHTFTPSAIGGGYDGFGGTSQNPTGATKEAIDQGRAIAMWSADRGDIYITL